MKYILTIAMLFGLVACDGLGCGSDHGSDAGAGGAGGSDSEDAGSDEDSGS